MTVFDANLMEKTLFLPALSCHFVMKKVPDIINWCRRECRLASQQDNRFLGSTHQLDAILNLICKRAKRKVAKV